MNTATRTLSAHTEQLPKFTVATLKLSMHTWILALLVMISGLVVVYLADVNRRLFIELQQAQSMHQQLQTEGTKLLLEQITWSRQAIIQTIAQQTLGMEVPMSHKIVMVKLNG